MTTPPPATMRLNAVPKYVQDKYNLTVTERTVRNWATKGLRNETLETYQVKNPYPTAKYPYIKVTSMVWVDEFLTRCQIGVQ